MKRILLLFAIALCFTALAQAALRKTIACTAGQLSTLLGSDLTTCSELIVTGTIDYRDFGTMRVSMPELVVVDLSDATITENSTYLANVVPNNAFRSCSKLLSVKLPKTATATGTSIFKDCTALKFIVFPASINYIGLNSLENCTSLAFITIKDASPNTTYPSNATINSMMAGVDQTKISLYVPQGTKTAYAANNMWKNFPNIGEFMAINNTAGNLEAAMGTYYSSCANLVLTGEMNAVDFRDLMYSNVAIADLSEANIVAYYGNEGCYSSFNVHYDADEVPPRAFQMKPNTIQYVDLPKSAKKLSFEVFNGCPNLKWVNIHDSVSEILYSSFYDCPNLAYLFIPSSVSSSTVFRNIQLVVADDNNPNYASSDSLLFTKDNTSLIHCSIKKTGSYTIPYSVKTLGANAFNSCKLITSVTIPSTITKYGDAVFYNCTGLKNIKVGSSTPYVLTGLTNSFTNVNKTTCTLYVPAGSKALYQAADLWKDFVNIVEYTSTISLSAASFEVDTLANTQSVTITSNTYGMATSDQTWVSIQQPNYTGNSTLKFDIAENTTASPRTAIITITADGTTSKQVVITQKAQVPVLRVSASALTFAVEGSTQSVDITSNTAWTATSSQTWLTINKKTGSGNFTLSCTTPAYTLLTNRTATITLSGTGAASKVINVTQNGVPAVTSVSAAGTSYSQYGGDINVTITSNTTWTITKSHAWLSLNKTSGTGNGTFICKAYTYSLAAERKCTVTISSPGVPNQTIIFTQAAAAPTLSASQTSINFSNTQSNKTLTIYSNTSWTASSDQTWLTFSPSSGTYDCNLSCSATENTLITSRTATITLSAAGVDSKTITITQDAAPISLALSETSLNFEATGNSKSVNVTTNTSWTVSSDQSWLTVSTTSGTSNGTFSCTATENTTTASRTATVTISATGVGSRTVTITQSGASPAINISEASLSFEAAGSAKSIGVISNTDWTINSDQTWLTLSATSGTGNATITCTIAANAQTASRSAIIILSATGATSQTITVSQDAAGITLTVSKTSLNFTTSGGSATVDITSNSSWTVSSNQTWLTVNTGSGSNNGTISITSSVNTTKTSRTGTVTISSTELGDRIISITQAGDIESGIDDLNKFIITIYPNPTQNFLYIKSDNTAIEKISVVNVAGKTTLEESDLSIKNYVDLSQLKNGIYFVKIQTEKKVLIRKILKN